MRFSSHQHNRNSSPVTPIGWLNYPHLITLAAIMSLASMRPRLRQYMDMVTQHWIGWTFPPVERAIDDADWKPDAADAYCRRCGDSVAIGEATKTGCATCRENGELAGGIGDGVIRLGPYADSLREWILKIKYQGWAEMGSHLGRELGRAMRASQTIDLDKTIVVPMPMPWQRRLYRGIDHARVIAHGVARELSNAPVVSILAKDNLPPQVTLAPSARRRHGSRGLRLRRRIGGWPLDGLHIVLVDDVRTTGSSLKAAVRMLRTLKPERIVCAVLAVSDAKSRRARAQQARHDQHVVA